MKRSNGGVRVSRWNSGRVRDKRYREAVEIVRLFPVPCDYTSVFDCLRRFSVSVVVLVLLSFLQCIVQVYT